VDGRPGASAISSVHFFPAFSDELLHSIWSTFVAFSHRRIELEWSYRIGIVGALDGEFHSVIFLFCLHYEAFTKALRGSYLSFCISWRR